MGKILKKRYIDIYKRVALVTMSATTWSDAMDKNVGFLSQIKKVRQLTSLVNERYSNYNSRIFEHIRKWHLSYIPFLATWKVLKETIFSVEDIVTPELNELTRAIPWWEVLGAYILLILVPTGWAMNDAMNRALAGNLKAIELMRGYDNPELAKFDNMDNVRGLIAFGLISFFMYFFFRFAFASPDKTPNFETKIKQSFKEWTESKSPEDRVANITEAAPNIFTNDELKPVYKQTLLDYADILKYKYNTLEAKWWENSVYAYLDTIEKHVSTQKHLDKVRLMFEKVGNFSNGMDLNSDYFIGYSIFDYEHGFSLYNPLEELKKTLIQESLFEKTELTLAHTMDIENVWTAKTLHDLNLNLGWQHYNAWESFTKELANPTQVEVTTFWVFWDNLCIFFNTFDFALFM